MGYRRLSRVLFAVEEASYRLRGHSHYSRASLAVLISSGAALSPRPFKESLFYCLFTIDLNVTDIWTPAIPILQVFNKANMATAEAPARAHGMLRRPIFKRIDWTDKCALVDRNGRRRPFSNWMKRLANLKNSSSESNTVRWSNKLHAAPKGKKNNSRSSSHRRRKNNPYPLSGTTDGGREYNSDTNDSPAESSDEHGDQSRSHSEPSLACSGYDNHAKSTTPTISTNGDNYSKAGTMATGGGGISSSGGGEGSTFSSPTPSVRSLTTTLTTVQSAAPSTHLYNAPNVYQGLPHVNSAQSNASQQVQFSHQFPPSPATAVPPHLNPNGHTYNTATANNMLTDNASILTLASSSKRRRRNSLDTNASVRALAPSSVFGGSRESLPMSVLSGQVGEPSNASGFSVSGALNRPSMVGLASAERASVYSGAYGGGGERGSLYTTKQGSGAGDGASIRSAAYSHGRNDSNTASVSGGMSGPTINQSMTSGRISRRSSGWGEITEHEIVGDESDDDDKEMEKKESDDKLETKTQVSTEDARKN